MVAAEKLACTVRGMRDLVGEDARVFDHILARMQEMACRYGYEHIEMPVLENTAIFARTLGEETDVVSKEMFSFEDRSGNALSLRPEGTASAVRALLCNKLTQTLPQRWFYYGQMFRYDRPQKGRYRQFFQFGVEYIGAKAPLSDVELIAMAHGILRGLGLSSVTLRLNSIGDKKSRQAYREKLLAYFARYRNDLSPDSQRRLEENTLRILDSKEESDQKIAEGAPSILDSLNTESRKFFDDVCQGLEQLQIPYEQDRLLVRGLDYYDHTTFEFTCPLGDGGSSIAVAGGGRYNGLVKQMGGPETPAVGLAFGIDRIMLACDRGQLKSAPIVTVLFVGEAERLNALALAEDLRSRCPFAIILPVDGDLTKRLRHSAKLGAACALILGEAECAAGQVKCKFLKPAPGSPEGSEETITAADASGFLIDKLADAISK